MSKSEPSRSSSDKLLFTPGPLTTSLTVKQAMLHDAGSRDPEFIQVIRDIREKLLRLGGVSRDAGYEAILMQGSGTFGVESVISSVVARDGKLLVVVNGAYGERMLTIASRHGISVTACRSDEDRVPDLPAIETALQSDAAITHVAAVHCETTTGILNPVEAIGQIVKRARREFIVDAMSSFGAIPLNLAEAGVDYAISSANKCIEGVPGFAFVLARREALMQSEGRARTLSLDLVAQWKGLERDGQFRFTPPTHSILAFEQALNELDQEGGVVARGARYRRNHEILVNGMRQLGFRAYLASEVWSYIITSFCCLDDPGFTFQEFYGRLADKGFVIYPGKISKADTFRIGSIGRIDESDMRALLAAIRETLGEMGVRLDARVPGSPKETGDTLSLRSQSFCDPLAHTKKR